MEALKQILPTWLNKVLNTIDISKLSEIRIRTTGVSVRYGGKIVGINEYGLCPDGKILSQYEIEQIVLKAADYSIYAVNDRIKNGYLTLSGGIRMGICGEVVDKTIKNFSSLNIRIPHEILGCAEKIINYVFDRGRPITTAIIAPPGCGKTTMLRDIIRYISNKGYIVLVADDKQELCGYDLGKNTDIIIGGTKEFGFKQGIRYMRPDVLACDELIGTDDTEAVFRAVAGGVNVIFTVHGNLYNCREKIPKLGSEMRLIILSDKPSVGNIDGVYDGNMKRIL